MTRIDTKVRVVHEGWRGQPVTSESQRIVELLSQSPNRGILTAPFSVGGPTAGRIAWLESDDARRVAISVMTYDLDGPNRVVMNVGFVTHPLLQKRGYCSQLLHAVLTRTKAQIIESSVVSYGGFMTFYRAAERCPKRHFMLSVNLSLESVELRAMRNVAPLPNLRIL